VPAHETQDVYGEWVGCHLGEESGGKFNGNKKERRNNNKKSQELGLPVLCGRVRKGSRAVPFTSTLRIILINNREARAFYDKNLMTISGRAPKNIAGFYHNLFLTE